MQNPGLYQEIGGLTAEVRNLKAGLTELKADLKVEKEHQEETLQAILTKLGDLERKLTPIVEWKPGAEAELLALRKGHGEMTGLLSRGMALFTVLVTAMTLLGTGFWQLIIHWNDLGAFWGSVFGRGGPKP